MSWPPLVDHVESQNERELRARWADLPPAGQALMLDSLSEAARTAFWADIRARADAKVETELLLDRYMEEPWCPACRDRTTVHEPGECRSRHQPSARSVAATSTTAGTVALESTDPLKRVPPSEYVEAFTGQLVAASRKLCCPLHEESTPSFHVYDDHWHCFGCHATGGVYELASRLTGLSTRGPEFLELRRWAAARLLDARGVRP
jgi:hypothetical protein